MVFDRLASRSGHGRGFLLGAALAVLAGGAALAAPAPMPVPMPLATHQAVYDLSLEEGGKANAVSDAQGRMVYDFAGSSCDGYTTRVRFVTRITDGDGNARLTDVSTTTFEDAASQHFTFSTKSYVDGSVTEDSSGSAQRNGSGIAVSVPKPDGKTFTLPAAFEFPNQHLETVIAAALRGDHFVAIDLFDGSEKGEKPYSTSAVIGPVNTGGDDLGDDAMAQRLGLDNLRRWPVTLSYFDQGGAGEQSPTYELSFVVYENGIIRRMRLDYGDFALTGKLVKLDLKPVKVNAGGKCR